MFTLNCAEAAGILVCGCGTTAEWPPLRKRAGEFRRRLTQNLGRDKPHLLSAAIYHFLHHHYNDGRSIYIIYRNKGTNTEVLSKVHNEGVK